MILLLLVAMTTLIFMTTTPIQSLKLFQNLSVKRRGFKSASRLLLNRILIDSSECISGLDINSNELIIAELKSTDYRYEHINKVLKMQVGQPFRAGVVDIGMTSAALILDSSADTNSIHDTKNITNEALISKSTLSSTTSSASSLSQTNTETMRISLGKRIDLQTVPKPPISLILAAPRPLRLERILPVASTLGVRHIAIIGAEKVQKDYLGIQMLQKPQLMRSMLVEGLEQVEVDYHLPTYSVHKSFNKFINFEIKSVDSPVDTPVTVTNTTDKVEIVRIITQPQFPIMIDTSVSGQVRTLPPSIRISELFKELFPSEITEKSEITGQHPRIHIIIAIGPEGGWTFDELNAFVIRGYRLVHFGDRILRTDTAVQVALGIANEVLSQYSS